jgi:hypothetical protein
LKAKKTYLEFQCIRLITGRTPLQRGGLFFFAFDTPFGTGILDTAQPFPLLHEIRAPGAQGRPTRVPFDIARDIAPAMRGETPSIL